MGAGVDGSPCGFCCEEPGDNVELAIDEQTYETIPAKLIIKAGLLAASQLIDVKTSEPCSDSNNESVKRNLTNTHFVYPRKVNNIKVRYYSGYKGGEIPKSFIIDAKEFLVERIIDQWRTPGYDCFKFLADDGKGYILKYDVRNDEWDLE